MPLSPRILRGLAVKGWKTYIPRVSTENVSGAGSKGDELLENQPPPPLTREQLEQERAKVLTAARREGEDLSRKILAQATAEAATLREKSADEGYKEGYARGEREAEKIKEEAAHILETARQEHRALLEGAEAEILRIATSLAEKLVNVQLEMNDEAALAMIMRCLEALPAGREVVLRVNPRDEPLCRRKGQLLKGLLSGDASLKFVGDAAIAEGSCIAESEEAEVSFLLHRELEILTKKLLDLAAPGGN